MSHRTARRIMAITLALAVMSLAACGGDDEASAPESGTRTIEIEMRDIAFSPDEVDVRDGETVRFVFTNVGEARHDAFIGDDAAQDDHEMEMRDQDDAGGMEHGEEEDGSDEGITVDPGEEGELTHTFREGDELLIGCHQPGHYAAGMKIAVNVS